MLRFNVPINVVAKILGHKDAKITLAHYQDLAAEDLSKATAVVPEIKTPPTIGPRRVESAKA